MTFQRQSFKHRLHDIIFEADTRTGKIFDEVLLVLILLSVIVAMWETVPSVDGRYIHLFHVLEWIFTILFTVEYFFRIYSTAKPIKYITSFYGVIDLLAILPSYLSLILAGTHTLVIIRALRLLRVFRIFKMVSFLHQSKVLMLALRSSYVKISIFLYFVIIIVCIFGSIMYVVEGGTNPDFDSIPRSVYWSVVTVTTVGYGDITPNTFIGQFLSAILMILGYAIIAVPTGILTRELMSSQKIGTNTQACHSCASEGHDDDALYCKLCGDKLSAD